MRKSASVTLFATLCAATALITTGVQSEEPKVELPADYASTYTNYLSLDRTQDPDQIIRLFANDIAMQGPGDDGKLPFGSVLVAEVYKAKLDADGKVLTSTLGQRIQDKFALIAVMQREEGWGESHPVGVRNGNWEMAAFKPDGSVAESKNITACMACHAPLESTNFVFSYEHLKN